MSQERDLLRTIAREPDDDVVRLVYADWLDEQGRADRAALIRAQVRLSEIRRNIPPLDEEPFAHHFGLSRGEGIWHCPGDSPERRDMAFRSRRLLDVHEEEWLEPFPALLRHEWIWSRGFIEAIDADPGSLAVSGHELFDLHPIRWLILTGIQGNSGLLASVPDHNRLTALNLILDDLDLTALRELTRFRHLEGLRELDLSFNRLRDSAIDFLCGEPFFQCLSLCLGSNPFTDSGRQRLREHFGPRVSFSRERHSDRLFAFQADAGMTQISPEQIGTVNIRAGRGTDQTQLFFEELTHTDTLVVFDYAGDLLHIETRSGWGKHEAQRHEEKRAWLRGLNYEPATIQVKRFPGVYDYPKSWSDVFDDAEAEPADYASGFAFLERWLVESGFRYGSFCGGHWFNRKSGKKIAL
jgi:uncharacterized protein (TIGR02996 family)